MCILIFSTSFILKVSRSKKNWARYDPDFRKKILKFHENPFSVSRAVPCGRTVRYYETNSRFSQFCERV
jgi:hypothetical protein